MSDDALVKIVGIAAPVVTAVFAGYISVVMAKIASKQAEDGEKVDGVAKKAQEVKETLANTTAKVDEKLDTIHTLVNSQRTLQLRAYAILARTHAATTKNQNDINAAEIAEAAVKAQEDMESNHER